MYYIQGAKWWAKGRPSTISPGVQRITKGVNDETKIKCYQIEEKIVFGETAFLAKPVH